MGAGLPAKRPEQAVHISCHPCHRLLNLQEAVFAIIEGIASMAVETVFSQDGKKLTIKIKGRFDFGKHQEFRDAYERQSSRPDSVVVDLKDTTYLDSSALGMLLLLRDHAGGDESDVRVVHASSDVRKILAISNFEKLFDIS
ncbi:anti-sigma-factor antagonist [Pseudomonas plecoglossicida]|nr:anti-sigma-factor antagonist [Pseudomonas plecoglossicida]